MQVHYSRGNTRHLYSLIRSLTGTVPDNPMPPGTEKHLADSFSDFFLQKIDKIRSQLADYPQYKPALHQGIVPLTEFHPVSREQVKKCIMKLKPKSCELDPLPASLFRSIVDYILDFLTMVFNKSLESGCFVKHWKCGVLRPLIKGRNIPCVQPNYRPVSNLPFLSKVLEKLALEQIHTHCQAQNVFPAHQSAYRDHHSCETVLAKITNDLLWSMERNQVRATLFLDLSAAFDTVDHEIMHQTLHDSYGIQGTSLQWIQSYLEPRYCKTAVGHQYSRGEDPTLLCSSRFVPGPVPIYHVRRINLNHYSRQHGSIWICG